MLNALDYLAGALLSSRHRRRIPASPPGLPHRPTKPAEVATRGQREAKDITYGDWQKLCFKAGGAPTLCRTSITGKFPTGQMAVRVDLIEREGATDGSAAAFRTRRHVPATTGQADRRQGSPIACPIAGA